MIRFKKLNTLALFDWFLIIGVITANIVYSILQKEFDLIGSLAGVSGVICVVLVAKGNILNYLFGIINVSLYAIVSYKASLYGDAALNALYYLPMQFIGWYSWIGKRESESSVTVEARRMSLYQRVIWSLISLTAVLIAAYILCLVKDPQPLKDSATTILSIIAMYFMVKRYMEQWVIWVIVNIISVVMWSIAFAYGAPHSALMVIMWLFYLANSINGWLTWLKLSKEN